MDASSVIPALTDSIVDRFGMTCTSRAHALGHQRCGLPRAHRLRSSWRAQSGREGLHQRRSCLPPGRSPPSDCLRALRPGRGHCARAGSGPRAFWVSAVFGSGRSRRRSTSWSPMSGLSWTRSHFLGSSTARYAEGPTLWKPPRHSLTSMVPCSSSRPILAWPSSGALASSKILVTSRRSSPRRSCLACICLRHTHIDGAVRSMVGRALIFWSDTCHHRPRAFPKT